MLDSTLRDFQNVIAYFIWLLELINQPSEKLLEDDELERHRYQKEKNVTIEIMRPGNSKFVTPTLKLVQCYYI